MTRTAFTRVLPHTRRGLWLTSAGGVLATGLTAWWAAASPTFVDPRGLAIWRSVIIATYWAAGVITWWRRPASRLGRAILVLTVLYTGQAAVGSPVPLVYTLGMVVWAASITYTAYVFLCFPTGKLESSVDRWFIQGYWVTTSLVWALILALAPTLPPGGSFVSCGTRCPPNALQIVDGHAATGVALTTAFHVQFTVALIGLAVLVVSRARFSTAVRRRAMTPLAVVMLADIVEFVVALFVLPTYPDVADVFRLADGVVTVAVPAAILIGQVRADRFVATRSSQFALGIGGVPTSPAGIETMLGDAIGDPSLRLALWDVNRAGYVDVRGVAMELPRSVSSRCVTDVTRRDQPVAALIHDPALDAESNLVAGLTATTLMLLEHVRLVHELRASRLRIVHAAEEDRMQWERDLHDGAQQQLVMIQAELGVARDLAARSDVREQLERAVARADSALNELRALSHGIYPSALHAFGLAPALRDLGLASPVPVQVHDSGIGRLSESIETEIYFCVREAIQDSSKHTGPGATVTVALARHEGMVEVIVRDRGRGIAATRGLAIARMRDRIESLGGEIHIHSERGAGTSIRVLVPTTDSIDHARPLAEEKP